MIRKCCKISRPFQRKCGGCGCGKVRGGVRARGGGNFFAIDYDFRTPVRSFSKPAGSQAGFDAWLGTATSLASLYLMDVAGVTCLDALGANNLTNDAGVLKSRRFIAWNGSDYTSVLCQEYPNFTADTEAASNTVFDFASASFGGFIVFDSASIDGVNGGVLGKATTAATPVGWRIEIGTTGIPSFTISDGVNTVARTLTSNHADGAKHYLVWWVNRSTNEMRLYSDLDKPAALSIAAVGSITNTELFRIGRPRTNIFCYPNRYGLVAIFNAVTGLDSTTAFDDLWSRITTRSLPNLTYTRSVSLGTVVGVDNAGSGTDPILNIFRSGEVAYAWRTNFTHATKLGLQLEPAIQNIFAEADLNKAAWTVGGTLTKTGLIGTDPSTVNSDYDDPRKYRWAPRLTKAAAGDNLRNTGALTVGLTYVFSVYLKVTSSLIVPRLRILDGGGATVATATISGMVVGEWFRGFIAYTAAATAVHTFEIHPSDPAAATGECWAQYAQLEQGAATTPQPTAFKFSNGSALTGGAVKAQSTSSVATTDEGRFEADYIYDCRFRNLDGNVMGTDVAVANRRLIDNSFFGDLVTVIISNSAGATAHSSTTAVTPGGLVATMLQWKAIGPIRGADVVNGTPHSTAGTMTQVGSRQLISFGAAFGINSGIAVVAKGRVSNRFI